MCLYAWVTVCTYIYLFFSQRGSRSNNTSGVSKPTLRYWFLMLFSSKRNQAVREMTDSRKGIGNIYNEARAP